MTTLEVNLMVIMTPMYNYQSPPVNQTTLPKLLEATQKMTKYFKKSYKHNKSNLDSGYSNHPSTNQYNTTDANTNANSTTQIIR